MNRLKLNIKKALTFLYKRPELVFVLIALPFGIFSALFVPQVSITDENSHLLRIYQLSEGELVCGDKYSYPRDIVDKSKSGSSSLRQYTGDFSDFIDDSDAVEYSCGSASVYSPFAYMPQVVGVAIAQILHPTAATIVLFARIASLLFYIIAMCVIIRYVKVGKYVFFVVALIPQMIHLAASMSADMMNNVVTLAIVAFMLNLFIQAEKISGKQVAMLFGLVVSAALLKLTIVLVFIPLVCLPSRIFKKNHIKRIPFNIQKWTLASILAGIMVAVYLAWVKVSYFARPEVVGAPNPISEKPSLFVNLLFNTYLSDYGDLVLRGVIGEFSSFLYHFPTILVFMQLLVLIFSLLYYGSRSKNYLTIANNKWLVLSTLLTFIFSILTITYGLYVEWGLKRGIVEYADGVQGRYFTALIVLLIPLFAWIGKYITIRVKPAWLALAIIATSQVVLLGFYVLYTIKILYT